MDAGKKRAGADLADILAAYPGLGGVGPGGLPSDYPTYVSLWCNLRRVWMQKAWAVKQGVQMAHTTEELPSEVFEAITHTEAEADELAFLDQKAKTRLRASQSWNL